MSKRVPTGIPPGSYTLEGLAKISPVAQRLVERLPRAGDNPVSSTPTEQKLRKVKTTDEAVRLRLASDEK